jgi:hypothetical protein
MGNERKVAEKEIQDDEIISIVYRGSFGRLYIFLQYKRTNLAFLPHAICHVLLRCRKTRISPPRLRVFLRGAQLRK